MNIDWPPPWRLVDDRHRRYIEGELAWELSHAPDHVLAGRLFVVVAMGDPYVQAVIRLDDGTFGFVRLSWRQLPPHFETIGGEAELVRWMEGRGSRRP